jgi:hypothetical protein
MDSDSMIDRDVEDVELAERLEAYAQDRLSPSSSATLRMRIHVMAAAERQAGLIRADADLGSLAVAEAATRARVVPFARWRRPAAALLAASLTLALAVGSVAAAQPGGPLYGARIWAETLTLPSTATERAAAEVGRMNDRLAEIAAAVAAGDVNAENAALAAYNAILAEAAAGANGNSAATTALGDGVRNNIAVLTTLLGRVPEQARDAIQHAIDMSDSAANGSNGGPPPSNPGNVPSATNRPTAKPTPPPKPDAATQRPHPTPKPKPTPQAPASTSQPEHSPRASGRPSPTPDANDQGG